MPHDLTRWIEDAEARRFTNEVLFERGAQLTEAQHFHLGDRIVHLTSQLRQGAAWGLWRSSTCTRSFSPSGRNARR